MTRRTLFPILLLALLLAGCRAEKLDPTQTAAPPIAIQPTATRQSQSLPYISHIRLNGNLFLFDLDSGRIRQITGDGTPFGPLPASVTETVLYSQGKWSSDGRLLAYERQNGQIRGYSADGSPEVEYAYSLWVYDVTTQEKRAILQDQQANGFAWKPASHLIAYGLPMYGPPISPDSVTGQEQGKPGAVTGIWAVDTDTGEKSELVKPERGYTLTNPQWSPNSQFISFDELTQLEGHGSFGYYDLAEQKYVAWDKVIGTYQWTPDSQSLVYDSLTGAPSGTERIFINPRQNTAEKQISPDDPSAFSHSPVVSPSGDLVAYVTDILNADVEVTSKLYVQSLQGGQPREIGTFAKPSDLTWASDGQSLLLSSGASYEERQVLVVSVADGTQKIILQGVFPSWQPVVPLVGP